MAFLSKVDLIIERVTKRHRGTCHICGKVPTGVRLKSEYLDENTGWIKTRYYCYEHGLDFIKKKKFGLSQLEDVLIREGPPVAGSMRYEAAEKFEFLDVKE